MAFGGVPLWADGTLTLRVRGLGFGAGRPLTETSGAIHRLPIAQAAAHPVGAPPER